MGWAVNMSKSVGRSSIDFLVDNELLIVEKSQERPIKSEDISVKLLFPQPFMRFWFSSIFHIINV